MPEIQSTNYEKYRSGNPVVLRLIERFYETLGTLVDSLERGMQPAGPRPDAEARPAQA